LPLEAFYECPKGGQRKSQFCKPCTSDYGKERYINLKTRHREVDCLYVLELEKLPGVYKIGHSSSPELRRKHFEKGPSRAALRLVEPGMGWAESAVQHALRAHREQDSPSREWFRVSLETIRAVVRAIAEA
jgi:hypothetical protein